MKKEEIESGTKRQHSFHVMYNAWVDKRYPYHPKITVHTYAVLGCLGYFADQNGSCFPSITTIGERMKISKPVVVRELKTLEDLNIISVERRQTPSGKTKSNLYILNAPHAWIDIEGVVKKRKPRELPCTIENSTSENSLTNISEVRGSPDEPIGVNHVNSNNTHSIPCGGCADRGSASLLDLLDKPWEPSVVFVSKLFNEYRDRVGITDHTVREARQSLGLLIKKKLIPALERADRKIDEESVSWAFHELLRRCLNNEYHSKRISSMKYIYAHAGEILSNKD